VVYIADRPPPRKRLSIQTETARVERAKIAGVAASSERERLRVEQPNNPRFKPTLARVRFLDNGKGPQ